MPRWLHLDLGCRAEFVRHAIPPQNLATPAQFVIDRTVPRDLVTDSLLVRVWLIVHVCSSTSNLPLLTLEGRCSSHGQRRAAPSECIQIDTYDVGVCALQPRRQRQRQHPSRPRATGRALTLQQTTLWLRAFQVASRRVRTNRRAGISFTGPAAQPQPALQIATPNVDAVVPSAV